MTRAHIVTTRSGIVIGGAYTPPPHRMGSQAEIIQAVLLSPGQRRRSALVLTAIALRMLAGGCLRWLLDRDLIATYLRHRRMFFTRRQSLLRTLYVWFPIFTSKAKQ